MSEPTPAPVPVSTEDNATIRAMREQIEAANRAAKEAADAKAALEARLTELERKDMDEKQRLQAELEDARKAAQEAERLRDEHGRFVSSFEKLYQDELAAIPEDKREAVQRLSQVGAWPDRVEALRNAKVLIGSIPPPPATAGTVTQPVYGTPPTQAPEAPKPLTPSELQRLSLGDALAARNRPQA